MPETATIDPTYAARMSAAEERWGKLAAKSKATAVKLLAGNGLTAFTNYLREHDASLTLRDCWDIHVFLKRPATAPA